MDTSLGTCACHQARDLCDRAEGTTAEMDGEEQWVMSAIASHEAKWKCDLKSPRHESALIGFSGSAALAPTADMQVWTAIETRLNTSTMVPQLLEPSGGVSQERWQCETQVHRVQLCVSVLLSGAISHVLISTIATAAAMAGRVSLATQTIRSIPQFMNRAIVPTVAGAHSGVVFRSPTEMTPSGTLAKQKQTA